MQQIKIHNNQVEIVFPNSYKLLFKVATQNDILSRLDAAVGQEIIIQIINPQKEDVTHQYILTDVPVVDIQRFSQLMYILSNLM